MGAWQQHYNKPKNVKEDDLFNITIKNPDNIRISNVVRDCRYSERTQNFIQIDDENVYSRYEIDEWQKQDRENIQTKKKRERDESDT